MPIINDTGDNNEQTAMILIVICVLAFLAGCQRRLPQRRKQTISKSLPTQDHMNRHLASASRTRCETIRCARREVRQHLERGCQMSKSDQGAYGLIGSWVYAIAGITKKSYISY